MAARREQGSAADKRHGRLVWLWITGHLLMIVVFFVTTLLGAGLLSVVDEWATTCSSYVPAFPNSPIDVMAQFHQCHHVLGLEIPTEWNPAIAIAFGFLSSAAQGWIDDHSTPPPAPEKAV